MQMAKSHAKELMATTTGTPNLVALLICFFKLEVPFSSRLRVYAGILD
jgi:hypothetical protein